MKKPIINGIAKAVSASCVIAKVTPQMTKKGTISSGTLASCTPIRAANPTGILTLLAQAGDVVRANTTAVNITGDTLETFSMINFYKVRHSKF